MKIDLEDIFRTTDFGHVLSSLAQPGDVYMLVGELGSGKTSLCRGFLRHFTGDLNMDVPSPSYLISLQYAPKGGVGHTVYHLDPYRLSVGGVACLLDFEKAAIEDILLIEWPSRLGEQLELLINSKAKRIMTIQYEGVGPQAAGRSIRLSVRDSPEEHLWLRAVLREWSVRSVPDERGPKLQRLTNGTETQILPLCAGSVTYHGGDILIMGIESSCDDTAVAIVRGDGTIVAECIASQGAVHAEWRGVVPKLAQEEHAKAIGGTVDACLKKAQIEVGQLSGIAVTVGPGLALCLLVGIKKAIELAAEFQVPIIRVHHMEAHMMMTRMPSVCPVRPEFPFVTLLVSGGHTMIVLTKDIGDHLILGSTIDDSVGEAFDKTARLLGITSIPGGRELEKLAALGDADLWQPPLPKPLSRTKDPILRKSCDMSFAGLKTAVLMALNAAIAREGEFDKNNLAAAFQKCCADHLAERLKRALQITLTGTDTDAPLLEPGKMKHVVIAGGVAANKTVNSAVVAVAESFGLTVCVPPPVYCTDNGVMVAWTGIERFQRGLAEPPPNIKDLSQSEKYAEARPRWPLGVRHAQCAGKINDSSGKALDRKASEIARLSSIA